MRRYQVRVGSKELEVKLLKRAGSVVCFEADGMQHEVEVRPVIEDFARKDPSAAASAVPQAAAPKLVQSAHGPGAVVAPMPGIIVNILVKEGDAVVAGSTLCVMEAMKMENNIIAPQAGSVKRIAVHVGAEVQSGQLLVQLG